MFDLHGRVAVVTGGGQGIGKGVALALAKAGADVVIGELNVETGLAAVAQLRELGRKAEFVETNVTSKESVENLIEMASSKFGRVDVLVNNAYAGMPPDRLENKTDDDFEISLKGSMYGSLWAMRACFPFMKKNRFGRIINLCSLNGVNAHMYTSSFNVSKEALRSLTRSAAREWACHNITANAICPAAATPAYVAFAESMPEVAEEMLKENPSGYMGDPEYDIGHLAVYLASEESRYLTGNTLFADGGSHLNGVQFIAPLPEGSE